MRPLRQEHAAEPLFSEVLQDDTGYGGATGENEGCMKRSMG